MDLIRTIVVSGGTHGNELTGVKLYEKWARNGEYFQGKCPSAKVLLAHTNVEATAACRRYIDKDLNRCFSRELLSLASSDVYEIRRAKELDARFGPKGPDTRTDLIIDVHNTTSNMGICLILSARDPFTMRASAEIASEFPDAFIYYQPEEREASPYFGTVAKADICLEVGPQPHGSLDAKLFFETERVVLRYLELAEEWNAGILQKKPRKTVDVYTQYKDIDYPRDSSGSVRAMVHPNLRNADYSELSPGDALFMTFDGEDILYEGAQTVHPIFIDESAYYEKKLAMSLTTKTTEEW